MQAILAKARVEIRARLRSLVALALILGIGGGAVMTALAAARRTDSVYARFQKTYPFPDLTLGFGGPLTREDVMGLPGVRAVKFAKVMIGETREHVSALIAPADQAWFTSYKVLAGRLPNPGKVEEVAVSPQAVTRLGLRPGMELLWTPPDATLDGARKAGVSLSAELRFRIVGVVVAAVNFGEGLVSPPVVVGTPALERSLPAAPPLPSFLFVFLERGRGGLPAFRAQLNRLAGGIPVPEYPFDAVFRRTQKSFQFQATALRLLGLLGGLALLLVLSQTLSRQATLLSGDAPTLAALGMTARQLRASVALVLGAVGAAGGIIAGLVAFAASPLALWGFARPAEVNPGAAFDAGVLGFGALAIAAGAVIVSLPATWRATRISRRSGAPAERGSSRAVDAFQRLGMSAPAVAGARLAFDRRARTPVPVRTTIAEIALGVAALGTVLTLSGTMRHFVATPALVGKFWDVNLEIGTDVDVRPYERQILAQPGVTGLAFGDGGTHDFDSVNGTKVGGMQVSAPVFGRVGLPIIEGRSPRAENEVALGTQTMRALRVRIGDRVTVGRFEDPTVAMTVVGRAVFEPYHPTLGLGYGMLITHESARAMNPTVRPPRAFISLDARVTSPDAFLAGFRRAAPGVRARTHSFNTPSEVVNFGNVQALPLALAGVLGAFALATLLHALVSVIRARRRDLAILKAIGFDRRQVARTVAWQAGLIVYVALAFGVPAGIVAGRALWLAIANSIGVVPVVHLPALPLVVIVPAALFAARLIAAFPARVAARTSPALVLRTE